MRFTAILLAIVLAVVAVGSYQPQIHRVSHGYVHIRPGGVDSPDSDLTTSTATWTNVGGWERIPQDWSTISVSFYGYGDGDGGGDPASGEFAGKIYVVHECGSASPVCAFDGLIGELQMSHDPVAGVGSHYRIAQAADPNHKWAEGPLVVTGGMWRTPVCSSGTTNGIGELNLDHNGATNIRVLFTSFSGVTKMYAVMTGRQR